MRYLIIPVLFFLAACNGNNPPAAAANAAPVVVVLSPLADVTVVAGVLVEIKYTDSDPDNEARTTIVAVSLGGVEIVIAANLPEGDGVEQTVDWDTSNVEADTYTIEIRADDGATTTVEQAPGAVTITAPVQNAGAAFAEPGMNAAASALLPDGSIVVIGSLTAPVTFGAGQANEATLAPLGDFDSFIARYLLDGTLLWVRQSINGGLVRIDAFPDGSFAVVGLAFGSDVTLNPGRADEQTLAAVAVSNTLIARYDVDGGLLWADLVPSAATLQPDIAAAPDGGTVLVGFVRTPARFTLNPGRATEVVVGPALTLMAKYDADGTVVFARDVDTVGPEVHGVEVAADGSIVACGRFVGSLAGGGQAAGGWVARFDAAGGLVWVDRAAPANGSMFFGDVALTATSNIVLNGSYEGAAGVVTFEEGAEFFLVGASGSFVASYSGDGQISWLTEFIDAFRGVRSLGCAADGSCVFSFIYSEDVRIPHADPANEILITPFGTGFNLGIARVSRDGLVVSARAYGPEGTVRELAGTHVTSDDAPVVVGRFRDSLTIEDTTLTVADSGAFVAVIGDENRIR